jgi:predicted permease
VYAGAIAIVATAMLSLAPLVRASMQKRFGALKEGSRTASGMGWRRVGSYLVMAELTLTVILLVSAGLLGRSLYSLLHVETGFNPEQLIVVNVSPVGPGSFPAGSDKPGALAHQVAARVAALPGVRSVGYADLTPIASVAPTSVFHVIGRPPPAVIDSHPVRRVSAAYFTTLQARLLHGRYFTDEEVASMRHVLIINETAMRRYFPDEDPLGRAIAFGVVGDSSPARQIVGVVADIKDGPLEHPAQPAAYVPFDQSGFGLVVRTSQPERPLIPTVVSAIREMRSDILVRGETTMMDGIRRAPSAAMQRASAWLVGGFAGTALVLSLVGLYGVVSYSVGQRAREIAVRIALGARRGSVYRLIVSQTARWVGAGTVAGVFGALAAATLMRRLLFGVASWDPLTLVATVMVVTLSALMASFIPARRAASVDPIQVLRAE